MTPTWRFPAGVAALSIVALLTAFEPSLQPAWKALSAVVAGVALLDLLLSRRRPALVFSREDFWTISVVMVVSNLPVMILEGIFTLFCITFLKKVRPEILDIVPGK